MTPKQGMMIGTGASVGLVILIVGVFLFLKTRGNTVGSPTEETAPVVLKKIDLKLELSKVITLPPADDTGAAVIYEAAVKEVAGLGDDFIANVKSTPDPEKKKEFKSILDKLQEAADKGLGSTPLNFEASMPITPGAEWQVRDTLYAMGQIATRAAMSMRSDKNKEGSEKALRAAIVWGDRLFNNGTYVAYKSAGLGCISEGLASAERQYSKDFFADETKEAAAKELYQTYLKSTEGWNKKEKLVRRIGPLSAPGDYWNLAENDQDRERRLDGLMWLGVAKWTEVSAGGQRSAIQAYLEQKAASPDPLIAQRAKVAAEFSREDVRMIRPQ